jgi:hypothetical protein
VETGQSRTRANRCSVFSDDLASRITLCSQHAEVISPLSEVALLDPLVAQQVAAGEVVDRGSTVASLSLREAARSAVAKASRPSFLRALPLQSTLTRAESLGGTSTTDSPEPASLIAR